MNAAFAPPSEEPDPTSAPPTGTLLGVLTAWLTSGALLGLAAGLTAQLIGSPLATGLPAVFVAASAVGGLAAWAVERRWSRERPAILDSHGRLQRPPHALLYAVPLLAAVPAMATLVLVATVAMDSILPAVLFGVGGFGLGWACRRLFSTHKITAALEALELGDAPAAIAQLEALENGWVSTHRGRTLARLNLGMLALTSGDLERAARFYTQVTDPVAVPMAHAGMALVRTLQDRLDDAEQLVLEALNGPGSEGVQGQLDAVRLLLTLRKEGSASARSLGETLHTLEAGELFRGLFALSLLREGAVDTARTIADDHLLVALEESGWRQVVPEIAELLVQPELA